MNNLFTCQSIDINSEIYSINNKGLRIKFLRGMKREEANNRLFMTFKRKKLNIWTNEEDTKLLEFLEINKGKDLDWVKAAEFLGTKNANQCSARYHRIRPGIIKGPWSKEEDEKLKCLVKTLGKNWITIAMYFTSRNSKQIRDRYLNHLDSRNKKEKFSDEEDNFIIASYKKIGSKWSKISKQLKDRTAEMVKNRFYSQLKQRVHIYDTIPRKKVTKNYYKIKKEKRLLKAIQDNLKCDPGQSYKNLIVNPSIVKGPFLVLSSNIKNNPESIVLTPQEELIKLEYLEGKGNHFFLNSINIRIFPSRSRPMDCYEKTRTTLIFY